MAVAILNTYLVLLFLLVHFGIVRFNLFWKASPFIVMAFEAAPFVVRVRLDDADFVKRLPAGSAGTAAIYTDHVKPTHVVRRVLLRQVAILNYVNPF